METDRDNHAEQALLTAQAAQNVLRELPGWSISADGRRLEREFTTKGFLRAQQIALAAGAVAEARNHHPDIRHGWGYCAVSWTSHDAGGLTRRDVDCAAMLNALMG